MRFLWLSLNCINCSWWWWWWWWCCNCHFWPQKL